MDVLYILGSGSIFNNEELRYSLRSLQRHLKNYGRVIVVGENPKFLSGEVEYHYISEAKGNKEYRISSKIKTACEKGIVNGDFLFMNDDIFFTKEVNSKTYPYLYKGQLWEEASNPLYAQSLINTCCYLTGIGKDIKNFDHHAPIIYNSEKFLDLEEAWKESKTKDYGFVVKSIYCNIYGIEGKAYQDQKLSKFDKSVLKKTDCFSCSDVGFRSGVWDFLKKEYPEKSKFEV